MINNSSYSSVFGRWLQTKNRLRIDSSLKFIASKTEDNFRLSAVQVNIKLNLSSFPDDGHPEGAGLLQEPVDVLGGRDGGAVDGGDDVAGSHAGPVSRRVLDHPEHQDSLGDVEWKLMTQLKFLDNSRVEGNHGDPEIPGKISLNES